MNKKDDDKKKHEISEEIAAMLGGDKETEVEAKQEEEEITDGAHEESDDGAGEEDEDLGEDDAGEPDGDFDDSADDEDLADDEDEQGDESDVHDRRDDGDEAELEDIGTLKAQVESLQAQLNKRLEDPAPAPKPTPPEAAPKLPPLELIISNEEFDAALTDKNELVKLLTKVQDHTFQAAISETLKRIPSIVAQEVSRESAHHQMVSDFFTANQDLLQVRKFVAYTYEQVSAENPTMSYSEALAATATRVRKELKMVKAGTRSAKVRSRRRGGRDNNGTPSIPDGSRSRVTPSRPSGIAAEIEAMERGRR